MVNKKRTNEYMGEKSREKKIEEFKKWLDSGIIASAVLEALEDSGGNVSLKNMKDTWINNLEHIMGDIGTTIQWHTKQTAVLL